jgi:hypothetical protein
MSLFTMSEFLDRSAIHYLNEKAFEALSKALSVEKSLYCLTVFERAQYSCRIYVCQRNSNRRFDSVTAFFSPLPPSCLGAMWTTCITTPSLKNSSQAGHLPLCRFKSLVILNSTSGCLPVLCSSRSNRRRRDCGVPALSHVSESDCCCAGITGDHCRGG